VSEFTINDEAIKPIKDKILAFKWYPEELRNWVVSGDQSDLWKELSNAIVGRKSKDEFVEIIKGYLDKLPDSDGNKTTLNPDDIYRLIRQSSNDLKLPNGAIIKAVRGRAGGLYIIPETSNQESAATEKTLKDVEKQVEKQNEQAEQLDKKERDLEKDYYPLVRTWANENGYPDCKITGGKIPGYKWENPDLVEIQYTVGEFTRTLDFEITSIEVKLQVVPEAIWQAAHYKKFSREVYVAFAKTESEILTKDDRRVFDLAVELGIGVLGLDNGGTVKRFKLIHYPTQLSPDAREIDMLISGFRELFKDKLEAAGEELRKRLGIHKITL
jgi:hypothetical protein